MLRLRPALIAVFAALLCLPMARPVLAQTAASGELRDVRYCELIVARRVGLSLQATVYNTLGLNDCPDAEWSAITEKQVKAQLGALEVVLNGPRHWVMDKILADGSSAAGETIEVGGIGFTSRAVLELSLFSLRARPYEERKVNRSTKWVYSAGQPVFVLTAPDGTGYAMQSYASIVDRTLAYDDLQALGSRLALPKGWSYEMRVPDQDLVNQADGQATILQDELQNTYQRLPVNN